MVFKQSRNMRCSSKLAVLLLSLSFFFYMAIVVHGEEEETDELVVASANNSSIVGKAECGKEEDECKEGNGGSEDENVFVNEDYIYTNSLP